MRNPNLTRRRVLQTAAAAGAAAAVPALASPARSFAAPAVQTATTLKVMVWGRPDGANWGYQAYQKADPEGAKTLTIEPIVGGENDGQVAEQFRLMLSSGGADMPDIINFNRIQVPEFASAGALADLTDLSEPFKADVLDSAYALTMFDDRVVSVPNQLKAKVWYYRADLFEQAGVDPAAIATLEDYVAAGQKFHAALPESFIGNMRAEAAGWLSQDILTARAPVSFFDRDAGAFQVATHPAFRTLFETIDTLRNPELVAPIDSFSTDWAPGFVSGQIGACLINEWMASFLPQYAPDQAGLWKARTWPSIEGSIQGSDSGGSVWVIPAGSKNIEAAFDYLSTIYLSKAGSLALLEYAGIVPVVNSARAEVPTMAKPESTGDNKLPWAPDFFGEDYFPEVFKAQESLAWIDFDPRGAQEIALMNDWTSRFLAGGADIDGALAGLQGDLESQIGDPWLV